MDNKPDLWSAYLGVYCGGYDSETDEIMLAIVEMIGRHSEKSFLTDIAKKLNLEVKYVSLMQYVLANAKVDGVEVFTYGTSPAGLFVNNYNAYWQFLKALRDTVKYWED